MANMSFKMGVFSRNVQSHFFPRKEAFSLVSRKNPNTFEMFFRMPLRRHIKLWRFLLATVKPFLLSAHPLGVINSDHPGDKTVTALESVCERVCE